MQPAPTLDLDESLAARSVIASLPSALAIEGSCRLLAEGQTVFSRAGERVVEGDTRAWCNHLIRVAHASGPMAAIASYQTFLFDCWACHTGELIEASEAIRIVDID